ncbi:MAG: tetratricopeptide repeat protein [Phycisphaerae bacterium]
MVAEPSDFQVPPPKDWQVFERHMRDLFEAHWKAPAQMHGRTGQPQCGVDIYGQLGGGQDYHGVQCKLHDAEAKPAVIAEELEAEADKATKFHPKLIHFILATTGPRDVVVQNAVRKLNERENKPFTVEVVFWDDILDLYDKHLDIFSQHYPYLAAPRMNRLHQLPSPPADFVGREAELQSLLEAIEGGVNISGLRGMGGIGKTALAEVLAHRLSPQYADGQFFLDLQGTSDRPLSAADAMAHVLRSFDPMAKPPEGEEALAAAYRSALHEKRTILLMDNARDAAQVRSLVPPPGSILLVTSRWHFAVEGLKPLDLGVLGEQEAIELLLGIEKRIGGHAPALAGLCGYLPLALRAAGSLLQVQSDLPPADYVRQLEEQHSRLKKIGKEGVPVGVEACLDLSYRHLPPKTAAVFNRLAVFPSSFDAQAEEAVCEDPGHSHLGELLRYSLVEYDEDSKRYRLHDLVRLFADAYLTDAERGTAKKRHAVFYLAVLRAAEKLYLKGGEAITQGLALFDHERANIEAGQAWACSQPPRVQDAVNLCNQYGAAGVYCLNLRQDSRNERIPWLEVALTAARQLKDRKTERVHLGNLGIAYADLGEVRKAVEYYEPHLTIARQIGDRRGESADLGNLGNAYAKLGEVHKAIEYYKQALTIQCQIGDQRGEGTTLGNLGNAYATLGEVHKAIKYHKRALAIVCRIGDRHGESGVLGNLGTVYANLGERRKATKYYERALTIDREIGDRRGEGYDLYNRSLTWDELGDRERAIADAQEALTIFEQIEDPGAQKLRQMLAQWRGQQL